MITAFKDIKNIIEESDQPENQITELNFSSVKIFRFTEKIKLMVQKCEKLSILKLCECQLNSLDKLPQLDIVALDLSINKYFLDKNRLKDSDLEHLTKYKNLSILNLSDNFISGLQAFQILSKCTQMKDLQLAGNDIEKLPNYRQKAFHEIKSLQLLDKLDQNGDAPPFDDYSDDELSENENQENSDDEQGSVEDECSENLQQSQENSSLQNPKKKQHKNESD